MRVTIRLYKRHDLDLLSLYCADNTKFKEEFKTTLKSYINKKQIKNQIPQIESNSIYSMPTKVSFHMILKDEDNELKDWIKNITRGRRNNIMKNIYRNSFPPIITPYLSESELNKFNLKEN